MTVATMDTLPFPLGRRGKVRDVYEVDDRRLLIVASDRVSAFDVVMRELIPHKGVVLTQMTAWWLRHLEADVPHHMITADVDEIVSTLPALEAHRSSLAGRAMLCVKTDVFPVECVVRGYLTGSAWQEYRAKGTLAGEPLPTGLVESQRLRPALFSPATKADVGHDENITLERLRTMIGAAAATQLERLARLLYSQGEELAASRGILIADTKFEFGTAGGRTLVVDEVLTPDSSRFWPAHGYQPGRPQPSFDKQPLRDYLAGVRAAGQWNGNAPPPPLPDEVVSATSRRYLDAYQRITGSALLLSESL